MSLLAASLPAPSADRTLSIHVRVFDEDGFLAGGDDQIGDDTFTFTRAEDFGATATTHVRDFSGYRMTFSIAKRPPPGWQHNLPSAAPGAAPVAPGTSPPAGIRRRRMSSTSPTSAPTAGSMRLFFRLGPNEVWQHNLPSAARGAVPVKAGTSPTTGTRRRRMSSTSPTSAPTAGSMSCFFRSAPTRSGSTTCPAPRRCGTGEAGHQSDQLVYDAGECPAHRLRRHRQPDP